MGLDKLELLALLALILLSFSVHELTHLLVAKYYSRSFLRLSILRIWIIPIFFATDIDETTPISEKILNHVAGIITGFMVLVLGLYLLSFPTLICLNLSSAYLGGACFFDFWAIVALFRNGRKLGFSTPFGQIGNSAGEKGKNED